jgi:glycosyltransferase involved in cell wall biosynthesis
MTIVVFSESTIWGGLEVHAVAFTAGLVKAGHRASIACLGPETYALYREHAPAEVGLVEVAPPARRSLWGWWRALAGIHADAAVLEKGTLKTGSLALDLALRLRFEIFIAILHIEPPALPARSSVRHMGGLLPGVGLWWYRWKWSGYLRSVGPQRTVCVSDSVRRRLTGDYAFASDRVITVPNGIDATRFQPDEAARPRMREMWAIPKQAFVYGSVGRLTHPKGLDLAIDAFAQLTPLSSGAGDGPDLVLVGAGEEHDALVAQADRLGVADRVVFPGFAASPLTSYQAFDVFLIPSRFEAMPFSLLEAMACGCQIIASGVGGIPDVLSSPDFGDLVPRDDREALAEAMQRALVRPTDTRERRSRAARQRVIDAFDERQHCAGVVALLESDVRNTAVRSAPAEPRST